MGGKWFRAVCAMAVVATLAVGCSAGSSGSAGAKSSFGPPEKKTLNVGVVPAMDSAGFFVALRQGLFAKEGLTIHYSPETSSETAIGTQLSGGLDVTGGNYVSYIQAVAEQHKPLEIVAEGSIMNQGAQVIFTMPGSHIRTLSQLQGHLLGVNAPGNIDYLLSASVLTENGISPGSVHFPKKAIQFPDMVPDLAAGKIAAATLPEPFASIAEQQLGAVTLADLNQGATQEFPIEGYVVTKPWAQQNPNTLKRFLAALEQGQEIADTNRAAVEQAFEALKGQGNGQVPGTIAAVMALDSYPIGIDPIRLQRVSDVMFQFGLLKGFNQPFSMNQMLLPSSFFDFSPYSSAPDSMP